MVNGIDLATSGIEKLVRALLDEGVSVREINTALMMITNQRWIDEVGEDTLHSVLLCEINQIEEGAYQADYVPPEARMCEEAERPRLVVVEGGVGQKSREVFVCTPASPPFGDFFRAGAIFDRADREIALQMASNINKINWIDLRMSCNLVNIFHFRADRFPHCQSGRFARLVRGKDRYPARTFAACVLSPKG